MMTYQLRPLFGLSKFCLVFVVVASNVGWNQSFLMAQGSPAAADQSATAQSAAELVNELATKPKTETEAPAKEARPRGGKQNENKQEAPDSREAAKKPKLQPEKAEAEKAEAESAKPKMVKWGGEDPKLVADWAAKGVWLSPPTSGPEAIDFSLVGEYVGDLKVDEEDSSRLGVQIRALGDGQFEARAYQGGLPGQDGFTEDEMMVLIGRRSGQTLVLSGGPWAMFAGPAQCRLINGDGVTLGDLPRAERVSPTLGAKAPEGTMVLFDGTGTDAFVNGEMTPNGWLRQGAEIDFMLSDFDLHLEFQIPHMPKYTEQARGNSGLYLQSRYECQVLDSFGAARVFNGLGALYRHRPADVNMAFPPLAWQTYDVHFTSARFGANGKKLRDAHVTSWVNGVKVHDNQPLPGSTGHGQAETTSLLPTKLQDHRDPVRYRNVWVIDRGLTGGIEFPVMANP